MQQLSMDKCTSDCFQIIGSLHTSQIVQNTGEWFARGELVFILVEDVLITYISTFRQTLGRRHAYCSATRRDIRPTVGQLDRTRF